MTRPHFIGLEEARQVLAEMRISLTTRRMECAAEKDAEGRRKLPFFIDPIEGTLKIESRRSSLATRSVRWRLRGVA